MNGVEAGPHAIATPAEPTFPQTITREGRVRLT
jgi:hypothetical protein